MNQKTKELLGDVKDKLSVAHDNRNIGGSERVLSVAAGAFIFYKGIVGVFKSPLGSLAEIVAGSALLLRGATGYCPVKDKLGMDDEDVTIIEHRIVER